MNVVIFVFVDPETAFETGDVNVVSAARNLDWEHAPIMQLESCLTFVTVVSGFGTAFGTSDAPLAIFVLEKIEQRYGQHISSQQ